jgi:hypothetical protein
VSQANQAPTLVVMAAGIGSRYGGLKQIDPIGPNGENIIDYALFDALRAGFEKVVFIVRRDIEAAFREKIGAKVEQRVETAYVFQDLSQVPAGFSVPSGRSKPWGTGHAVLACRGTVHEPFAAINADDFYGPGAFRVMADYLRRAHDRPGLYDYSMVGYVLRNTLSAHGYVSRGVCQLDAQGCLQGVTERVRIEPDGANARYSDNGADWLPLDGDTIVSMNMWGFTPSMLDALAEYFPRFLQNIGPNPLKAEFFLPETVNALLKEDKARVKVLPTQEKWFGVTYPEDRAFVQAALRDLVSQGIYPANLWADR